MGSEAEGVMLAGPVSKENVEQLAPSIETWSQWRKTSITSAIRIIGPFVVETSEGPLSCEDGWLAIDARGYPYPIADDEFRQIYAPAGDDSLRDAARSTLGDLLEASDDGVRLEAVKMLLA